MPWADLTGEVEALFSVLVVPVVSADGYQRRGTDSHIDRVRQNAKNAVARRYYAKNRTELRLAIKLAARRRYWADPEAARARERIKKARQRERVRRRRENTKEFT